MANDLAVTQREHPLADNAMLMTTTDTQSRITYVNDAFVEVSGYSRDEIMGGNLSMFRHPDMPTQAFADMWESLKAGLPWNALIKNRCKNGDHFWVHANATPIMRDGVLAGYMSVRTKAQAHEVTAAEAMYRRFREGRAKGLAFYRGMVVRTGALRWMSLLRVMSVRSRLRLTLALTTAVAFGSVLAAGVAGTSLAVSGGGLLGSALLAAWLLERQLAGPLSAVLQQAQALANGQPVSGTSLDRVDEVGMLARAVNQAGLNLRTLVDDVSQHMMSVDQGSVEVAQGSNDLSGRTEQQASALEETAASMEELGSTVRRNADHARQGNELAQRASGVASRGGEAVSHVVRTMRDINDSSQKIADIIQVIDGIAFQTNILALNAAVEAARAGEQGRGFAVVAAEVRSLAGRSAEAAKEIKALINASVERVERGSELVDRAGATMNEVVDSIQQVVHLTSQISTASQEQAMGVAQVGEAVNLLDQATQQNAALVEQSTALAGHLKSQVDSLMNLVRVFKSSNRLSTVRGA